MRLVQGSKETKQGDQGYGYNRKRTITGVKTKLTRG